MEAEGCEYKILDSVWHSSPTVIHLTHLPDAQIGVVAVETFRNDTTWQWRAYIGLATGFHSQTDAQNIATWGAPLGPDIGHAYFPHIDIEKYKRD